MLRKISPQNHDSYKQALIKKIQMVTDYMIPSHTAFEGVLSLEQAFELLGRAQARLAMLEDIRKHGAGVIWLGKDAPLR